MRSLIWNAFFAGKKHTQEVMGTNSLFKEAKRGNFDLVERVLVNAALCNIYNQVSLDIPKLKFEIQENDNKCVGDYGEKVGIYRTEFQYGGLETVYVRLSNFDVFETNKFALLIKQHAASLNLKPTFEVTQTNYPAKVGVSDSSNFRDSSIHLHLHTLG